MYSFQLLQKFDSRLSGLSFRTNFGYNYRNNFVGSYYGRNTTSGKKVNGSASIENIHYYDYTWENLLKYNKTFGLHKIDATALFSMQENNQKGSKRIRRKFCKRRFRIPQYGWCREK